MRARSLGLLIPALLLFALSISTAEEPASAMKETVICAVTDADDLKKLVVSPDHRHCAFIRKADKSAMVVIDGKEGKVFNKVLKPVYSPDSTKVAYAGYDGKSWSMIENGKAGAKYDDIDGELVLYTPDSKSLVYVATKGGKQFIVLAGKEQKPYKNVEGIRLSTDGKHIGAHVTDYVASTAIQGTGMDMDFWSIDGNDLTDYSMPLAFSMSPNGKRYAVIAGPQIGGWIDKDDIGLNIFIDGEKIGKIGSFSSSGSRDFFVFSPDSKRLGYIAGLDKKTKVIVDGKACGTFDEADGFSFSPCSKHYAFFSGTKDAGAFYVNGKKWQTEFENKEFDKGMPVFCGDRVAILASTGEGKCIIENDVAGSTYKWVSPPLYNIKKELCYLAGGEGKIEFIVAGKSVSEVEGEPQLLFSILGGQDLALVGPGEKPAFLFLQEKECWLAIGSETFGPLGDIDAVKKATLPCFRAEKSDSGIRGKNRPPDMPDIPEDATVVDGSTTYSRLAFANGTVSLIAEKEGNLVLIEVKVK